MQLIVDVVLLSVVLVADVQVAVEASFCPVLMRTFCPVLMRTLFRAFLRLPEGMVLAAPAASLPAVTNTWSAPAAPLLAAAIPIICCAVGL